MGGREVWEEEQDGRKGGFEDKEGGGEEGFLRWRRKAGRGGLKKQEMGGREVWEEKQDGRNGRIGG